MTTFIAPSPKALPAIAQQLLLLAGNRKVWLFEGDMGAGKTTLIKVLCKQLGVVSDMSSPTFSIVNEYATNGKEKVFHFDLYRLKKASELNDIGFDDYLYSGQYCLIEWPHQVEYPYEEVFRVSIRTVDNVREIVAG